MRHLLSAIAVSAALVTPVQAEETYEQRLALATGYIDATLEDIDMAAMIKTMWQPIVNDIKSKGIPLNDDQIARINQLYQDEMTGPMYEIMRDQAAVMAELFTFDEIKAIRDFYATDLGRSAMSKLPQVTERQTPIVLKLMQEKMPEIIPKVQAILSEGATAQ
ncbi:hypothetical protein GCM10016455_15410 [Aliiroseovarius zhejiangensis]|uniref:DUF2059 domain-containing protein n=1 Tax=Aliiroseovarius zhejiangensis TaxID=1632025 RepID=A0ABQ3IY77_9RHOB|nr:DUF2059 domain-containing protein [Aliiroseovarius zhejiangensis]GHE95538.1 hypothetical protein GCM10016455_15410 [Aliiroseovarius zhejiangensis]